MAWAAEAVCVRAHGGPPMAKLGKDEVVTIRVLKRRGESASRIARELGVTEGAVRYRLRREASGAKDGRQGKTFGLETLGLERAVGAWWAAEAERIGEARPPCVRDLFDYLRHEHGYGGSYKAVLRYARRRFGVPAIRTYRRIETPPGVQSQSDWAERTADVGDEGGPTKLYAFVMVLSHSRRSAVVWCRSQDQLSWHQAHTEAYRRLGGVAPVNRIDNLKTGVARGAGAWGKINESYRIYARQMRFHVDPHQAYRPEQKGKVERKVQALDRLGLSGKRFEGLAARQAWTDAKLAADDERRLCPATGKTVAESWREERPHLQALPATLPDPFDLVRTPTVAKDCTVRIEGRVYGVPFRFAGTRVEVRGTAREIQICDPATGELVARYPRGTAARIQIDEACYRGKATLRVLPPPPLGKMARKILEIAELPVEARPIDVYAALAGVAR